LFRDARWRRNAIIGLLLATSGVLGLWGIGFFSIDLGRSVFRKVFEQRLRDDGRAEWDRDLLRIIIREPGALDGWAASVKPVDLINSAVSVSRSDAQPILASVLRLKAANATITSQSVLEDLDARGQTADQRTQRTEYLSGDPQRTDGELLAKDILARSASLNGELTKWVGYLSIMLNLGGFFGIYGFGVVTQRLGRRPAFAIAFVLAAATTILTFSSMQRLTDIFWMVPMLGFGALSPFGGYAIYFPELFPTWLRSTGTSFCYNVGRFLAATGPYTLGQLAGTVFGHTEEPLRWAGITMCSVFLVGLLTLPFAPETKDQPLPE
jgi:hypothetical protein